MPLETPVFFFLREKCRLKPFMPAPRPSVRLGVHAHGSSCRHVVAKPTQCYSATQKSAAQALQCYTGINTCESKGAPLCESVFCQVPTMVRRKRDHYTACVSCHVQPCTSLWDHSYSASILPPSPPPPPPAPRAPNRTSSNPQLPARHFHPPQAHLSPLNPSSLHPTQILPLTPQHAHMSQQPSTPRHRPCSTPWAPSAPLSLPLTPPHPPAPRTPAPPPWATVCPSSAPPAARRAPRAAPWSWLRRPRCCCTPTPRCGRRGRASRRAAAAAAQSAHRRGGHIPMSQVIAGHARRPGTSIGDRSVSRVRCTQPRKVTVGHMRR